MKKYLVEGVQLTLFVMAEYPSFLKNISWKFPNYNHSY